MTFLILISLLLALSGKLEKAHREQLSLKDTLTAINIKADASAFRVKRLEDRLESLSYLVYNSASNEFSIDSLVAHINLFWQLDSLAVIERTGAGTEILYMYPEGGKIDESKLAGGLDNHIELDVLCEALSGTEADRFLFIPGWCAKRHILEPELKAWAGIASRCLEGPQV